ncbi:MAG: response regulator transcription factor [Zoogloeaceae bacterium]|nr:response regulator transcription factor [Zoogloeaceae bacterium]
MGPPLRVLIVDDEAPARARLRDVLADIAAEVPTELVGMVANGREALAMLESCSADVALVDVRMPVLDGVGLAQELERRGGGPAVIFTTAYDEYAVQAFDVAAADYLVKPVRGARLAAALTRVIAKGPGGGLGSGVGRSHFTVTERGRLLRVPLEDVLYLIADHKYTVARTLDAEYLLEDSLASLEAELGDRFVRIHRNCLVARAALVELIQIADPVDAAAQGRWEIAVAGRSERLAVSRRLLPTVRKALAA